MKKSLVLPVFTVLVFAVSFSILDAYIANHDANAYVQPTVTLDKTKYTWTDKVNISVTAPDQNHDPNKIEIIGNTSSNTITISTRGQTLTPYTLVETGPNTGVFTGSIILTGGTNIKDSAGVDGYGMSPTGAGPSGVGPNDGLVPADNVDGISVSYQTTNQTVVASAKIGWNTGVVNWLNPVSAAIGQDVCQITDPDMNLNPNAIDTFYANAWSTSDSGGIKMKMNETGQNTGIFQGTVHFINSTSSGNKLYVKPGDVVTCEYKDRTLPPPYTAADQLRIDATSTIATPSPVLNGVTASNPRIVDTFGKTVTGPVNAGQQVQIAANLTNNQNTDQPFVYLVQIQDQNGATVTLSWLTGTLTAGQALNPELSWTPTASGTYNAQIIVLQSIANPLPLSQPLTTTLIVQGGQSVAYSTTPVPLTGTVNTPAQGGTATLLIFDPNSNFVQIAQASVTSDGKFTTAIKAGGPLFKVSGIYSVKVEYSGTTQSNLSFNYTATNTNSSPTSLHTTTTAISPNSATLTSESKTFTATVSDPANSSATLTGIVSWNDSGAGGMFSPAGCVLLGNHCSLAYTPPQNPPNGITITATYTGDSAHSGSSGASSLIANVTGTTITANATTTTNPPNQPQPTTTSIEIPQWIHNNAKMWSNGSIDDGTFDQGLQYMIRQGIIKIPPTQSGPSTGVKIPQWVRNDASYWSTNQIDDTTFVGAIQYLIQAGIISP